MRDLELLVEEAADLLPLEDADFATDLLFETDLIANVDLVRTGLVALADGLLIADDAAFDLLFVDADLATDVDDLAIEVLAPTEDDFATEEGAAEAEVDLAREELLPAAELKELGVDPE